MLPLPPVPEMERAYQARDASYDGIFFLGVRTHHVARMVLQLRPEAQVALSPLIPVTGP